MGSSQSAMKTSNTGSRSFDQRVRGGIPSFMARESFARNVGVTPPARVVDIYFAYFLAQVTPPTTRVVDICFVYFGLM